MQMSKLNISDLCNVLVSKNGLEDNEAQRFVKTMFDIIQEGLEEDKIVKVKGLGTFKIIEVDDRESINVNTGERVLIAGHSKVTFTPDSVMKEIVNKPFSQFETVVLNDGVDFPETVVEEPSAEVEEEVEMPVAEEKAEMPVMEEEKVVESISEKPQMPREEIMEETPIETEAIVEETPVEEETPEPEPPVEIETPVESIPPTEPTTPTLSTEPTPSDSPEEEIEEETEEEEERKISPLRWIIGAVVILLLAFAGILGGYMYGKYEISKELANEQMKKDLAVAESVAKKAAVEIKKDSAVNEVDATKIGTISVENVKEEPAAQEAQPKKEEAKKEVVKKEEVKTEQSQTDTHAKYAEKDARVRTGAYRIVGLDRTVKAKAGQKLEDLANRLLGPGMSCYVEVYNDLSGNTALKEGQTVKIPKLELKKKRVAQ